MKESVKTTIRIVTSIVISAVLLGLIVSYCIRTWMPSEALGWILWGAMVCIGIYSIFRIANLAKLLGGKDNE